jgi:dienelactone hydrolase
MAFALRLVALALIAVSLTAWQDRYLQNGTMLTHVMSARYQLGPLQQRLARERGETVDRRPIEAVFGYLTMPETGSGPFPAIVHLHGCGGLPKAFKDGTEKGLWPARLAAWGYVVLTIDSFTTRGIDNTCSGEPAPRTADAYGALDYLAHHPLVDANRIAVIGFSSGGIATLSLAEAHDFELFEDEAAHRFKAAVALYPACAAGDTMKMPTLILIGELDDWSQASACRAMMARQTTSSPAKLIVYPGAYHGFDAPAPGRRYFGHWLEYNAAAAEIAKEEVHRFLAEQLGR